MPGKKEREQMIAEARRLYRDAPAFPLREHIKNVTGKGIQKERRLAMSLSDGECKHGIAFGEGCLLCPPGVPETRALQVPTAFNDDVKLMIEVMLRAQDWRTSDSLIASLKSLTSDSRRFSKTYIRHLSKGTRGRVISGQRGYKATGYANVDEVQGAAASLLKAATGCMDRRSDILFAFHHGRAPTDKERTGRDGVEETTTTPAS